jgi:hypothetical protein
MEPWENHVDCMIWQRAERYLLEAGRARQSKKPAERFKCYFPGGLIYLMYADDIAITSEEIPG